MAKQSKTLFGVFSIGAVAGERIGALAVALPDIPWLGLEGPLVGPEDIRR